MKRINKITIVVLCIPFLILQGCYTSKPTGRATSPDYNQRVTVSDAKMKKKGNGLDIVFNVGLVGAGAVGGYNMNLVQKQTATGKEPVHAANAAIGAFAGATVAYLVDVIAGKNKSMEIKNPNEWIQKANKDYILLTDNYRSGNSFMIMHPSAERNYTVRNINDVRDFNKAFFDSRYENEMVESAISKLSRSDLPELITLYSNNKHIETAKEKYIISSPNYQEALNAARKYPINNVEKTLVDLIKNADDAVQFLQSYPSYPFKSEIVINAFKTHENTGVELQKLQKMLGPDFYLTENDLYQQSNAIKRNYFNGMYLLAKPKNINAYNNFVSEYLWLNYNGMNLDFLSYYWDIIEPSYSKGSDVLTNFAKVVSNPISSSLRIKQDDLIKVTFEKLRDVVKNNVRIVSQDYFGAQNEDFEKWKRETGGPIALMLEGEVSYLIYGEIQNNSKFDLPIEITAGGMLRLKRTNKAANWLDMEKQGFSLLGVVAEVFAMSQPNEIKDVEYQENSCLIPALPAHKKTTYAVLVDFGKREQGGAVIAGLFQQHIELLLSQIKVQTSFFTNDISVEQLQKQAVWQDYAKNKVLPSNAILYDYSLDLLNWHLGGSDDKFGGVDYRLTKGIHDKIGETKTKVENYIVDIMSQPTYYSYGTSSNTTNGSAEDEEATKVKDSKTDIEKVTHPGIKKDHGWDECGGFLEKTKSKYIEFQDASGTLNYNCDSERYYIDGGILSLWSAFYDREVDALNALYVYLKYNRIRQTGRNKSFLDGKWMNDEE